METLLCFRIFPFVAADALPNEKDTKVTEAEEKVDHALPPTFYPGFSPPSETEGLNKMPYLNWKILETTTSH